jgi:hypothetical protein
MTNKIIFTILCLALLKPGKVFSQENREAFLRGYNNRNEYLYFDSVNKVSNDDLKHLDHTFSFYVVFKIDTTATVIDFEIIEIPVAEILPAIVKTYIKKLVMSTNGKWLPQIKSYKKVISDEMIYQGDLVKKEQSIGDRMKDSEPIIEYFLGPGISTNERLKKLVVDDHKRYMILSY